MDRKVVIGKNGLEFRMKKRQDWINYVKQKEIEKGRLIKIDVYCD